MVEDDHAGEKPPGQFENPFEQEQTCQRIIEYLNINGLGRTIVNPQRHERRKLNGLTDVQVLARTIAKSSGTNYEASETVFYNEPLGSILSTAPDSDEYLVILANNDIILIRLPNSQEGNTSKGIEDHRRIVSPSLDPIIYVYGDISRLAQNVRNGNIGGEFSYRLVADSSRPEDREKIIKTMQKAFTYSRELQQKQELAKRAVASEGLQIFGKTFPDFNPPPPPEPPTTPTE